MNPSSPSCSPPRPSCGWVLFPNRRSSHGFFQWLSPQSHAIGRRLSSFLLLVLSAVFAVACLRAAAQQPVLPVGTRFIMSHFSHQEKLWISVSPDGLAWTALNGGAPVWEPPGYQSFINVVRDPAIIYEGGAFWVAYTSGNYGKHASFGLLRSTDLLHWSFVGEISTQIPGATDPLTWSPTWFRDGDGAVHLFVNISPVNGSTYDPVPGMRTHEMHPLNEAFTAWSAPLVVELPSANTNEFWVWKEGDTYHAIYISFAPPSSDRSQWFHVVSDNLTSGWREPRKLGFHSEEGGMLVRMPDGGYRFFLEPGNVGNPPGYRWCDADEALTQFSGQQRVTATVPMRNGKMILAPGVFTYADWKASRLAAVPAADQAPGADPDHDRNDNLLECLLDLEPLVPDTTASRMEAGISLSGATQFLSLRYRCLPALGGVSHRVEVSPDLSNWHSGPVVTLQAATMLSDGSEQVWVRDTTPIDAAAPRRFMRLSATLVEDP